ncbi:MAG: ABC transporter substrate-binding protein [Deltaproteobacteria bacterium]|nr:ABC transporter substrate-binding protein [Deltaproteobacteria bacterium]
MLPRIPGTSPLCSLLFAALAIVASLGCNHRTPRDPGEFRVGIEGTPDTLDPRYASDAHGMRILPLLFNGLLSEEPSGQFRLDLAESWQQPDPLTHVFRLRAGVRFHDGAPLTARDVAATFRFLLDPAHGCPATGSLKQVAGVDAPDDRTVVFHLSRMAVSLPYQLTIGILPERLAGRPDLGEQVIGTGPYRLAAFRAASEVVLKAFTDYFAGPPHLESITFRIVSNATTRLLEIESGGLDLLQNAVPPFAVKFLRRNPELEVLVAPGSSYQYLGFNFDDPLLRDVRIRKAISFAIDRRALIDFALEGFARPATGLFPPEHWAADRHLAETPYDPVLARRLLDEAGHPDPDGEGPAVRFHVSYKTSTDKTANEVARIIADQLARVGIGVEVRGFEWGTFFSDVKKGNFQLMSLRWVGMNDPDSFHFLFHSASIPPAGANRGRYRNAEVDALIDASRGEPDPERRRVLYLRIQEALARDVAYASLWWLDNVVVLRRGFTGFRPLPGGEYTSLAGVRRVLP